MRTLYLLVALATLLVGTTARAACTSEAEKLLSAAFVPDAVARRCAGSPADDGTLHFETEHWSTDVSDTTSFAFVIPLAKSGPTWRDGRLGAVVEFWQTGVPFYLFHSNNQQPVYWKTTGERISLDYKF